MNTAKKAALLFVTAGMAGGAAAGSAVADTGAEGAALRSSRVPRYRLRQRHPGPVHVPVNLCGTTVDVVGVLNPAFGNTCADQ
ncbi:chaplin [Streptomyces sp. NBC_01571]|uniref:chaplin n=1 Tax=Streptomyces sp. NBC_01571 TaxID=2975883 RepID=UPI00225301A9|nr:chaplin [Streptomyces sp. NBC_01571]MCX4575059.1 chaplin [Streptomyces sp. NBC_01571]